MQTRLRPALFSRELSPVLPVFPVTLTEFGIIFLSSDGLVRLATALFALSSAAAAPLAAAILQQGWWALLVQGGGINPIWLIVSF